MKKTIYLVLILAVLGVIVFALVYPKEPVAGKYDDFAACLALRGIVMYGADWCPHCQNEKRAFGDSFRLIPYVECPKEPKKCLAANIEGYPTWITGDGRRLGGEQGLEKLSRESGCALPNDNQ